MSRIIAVLISLPSRDLRASLEFYTKVLNFEEIWSFDDFCMVAHGPCQITFYKYKQKIPSLLFERSVFMLEVQGIHEFYESVKARGKSHLVRELELSQPGVWDFTVSVRPSTSNEDYGRVAFSLG